MGVEKSQSLFYFYIGVFIDYKRVKDYKYSIFAIIKRSKNQIIFVKD